MGLAANAQKTGQTKALIVVDVQNGLTERKGIYQIASVIDKVNYAIKKYREKGYLIVFVQHNNGQLKNGTEKWLIDSRIDKTDKDLVVQKSLGNAFNKTDLETILRKNNIEEIVVCGLITHFCVKATCLGGLSSGFKTALLKNAHTNCSKNASEKIRSTEMELEQKGVLLLESENL
jgi:nicotinamidase-related amidase